MIGTYNAGRRDSPVHAIERADGMGIETMCGRKFVRSDGFDGRGRRGQVTCSNCRRQLDKQQRSPAGGWDGPRRYASRSDLIELGLLRQINLRLETLGVFLELGIDGRLRVLDYRDRPHDARLLRDVLRRCERATPERGGQDTW